MNALTDIPFAIDTDAVMAGCRIDRQSDDGAELESLIRLATGAGKPKAAYAVSFIEGRGGDTVTVNKIRFTSRTLAHNLQAVERVFPFVATCGREMDEMFSADGDMLKSFWWDAIKAEMLKAAESHVLDHLRRTFRLGRTATMRPGSGDAETWPVEQQQELFTLLGNVERGIGVKLTDSSLMIPNKSTSGIMFPAETDFRGCEVCHRAECRSRRAPFNNALWERIRRDEKQCIEETV